MEPFALIILGAVLFAHGFSILGVTEVRTTAIVAAAGAIGLLALTLWRPLALLTDASAESMTTVILLWVIYAAALAAVGLWNFDPRALGIYSVLLAVLMLVFGIYFFIVPTLGLGLVALVLAVVFAMLFFYLGPPMRQLRIATGWIFLVGSVLVVLVGAAFPLDLMETLGLL